ncbi:MAG: FecR domain-containing protein [Bacteroidales bacterium]|nr:FecR domain-containing protein [Bacteroidales bacterium]MCF8391049.1 FecR domain-containing protein [Bacteroidales bacterium]
MKTPQNDNVPYELIARYFSGEASVDEIIDVEGWVAASSENKAVLEQFRKLWEKTGQSNLFVDINLDNEWNAFLNSVKPSQQVIQNKTRSLIPMFYRIAALIILGLILGLASVLINNTIKYEKIIAGNVMQLVPLPDGSRVFLNKESTIKYPKSFKKSRFVTLEGEAFFEVNPDKSKPFIVNTGKLRVEVLGTSFNVQAYKEDEILNVIVETGIVAVYKKSNFEEKEVLHEGDKISYHKASGEHTLSKNIDDNYNAWFTRILKFENSSLEEVLNTLTNIYGIDFQVNNKNLYNCRLSVTFDHDELEYILKTISLTLDIKFENHQSYILVKGDGC